MMNAVGIVAEYNPFHTGHGHQISETRRKLGEDTPIVVAMSGNWVQQADCAIYDKWTRAKLAIMGGADLIIELPTPYATASAEAFCRGAVDILAATGVVTHLSFGSEGGDVKGLQAVAKCIDHPELTHHLRHHLDGGMSFPVARQMAVEDMIGEGGELLKKPNNTLGIEYLRAISAREYDIIPVTVLRRGGAHNSVPVLHSDGEEGCVPLEQYNLPEFTSATDLRFRLLEEENWDYLSRYLPKGGLELLQSVPHMTQLSRIERAMLAKVRTMSIQDWASLPDSGEEEGLPQRLEKAAKSAKSMEEFFEMAKTKRYTHARLRRLAMWAFLGIQRDQRPERPPYLRVLAFNGRGRQLLKEMKERATLPILTKTAQWESLPPEGRQMFQLECRCTDLYTLCMEQVGNVGMEYTQSACYVRD